MLDWVDGALDGVLAIVIVGGAALLLAILVPRLLRRLGALLRGEVEILLEPWTSLRTDGGDDISAGVGEMLLFELRRVQDIHARTVNRIEISNTYRDIPTFSEGLSTDIDLLASEELEGEVGRIATFTGVILRLLPLLTPRTRLHGSVRQFDESRSLELTLEHYPVLRRPAYGASPRRRRHARDVQDRLARIWQLMFGQRQTLTWRVHNDAATNGNLGDDVVQAAYGIYLDLLADDTFKSWKCFRLFTQGLERHVRYMDLDRPDDLDCAEDYYRQALRLEPKNQVVSYNLGIIQYMRYRSAETNREAIDLFYNATSAASPQLKARAYAGIANAGTMAVDRFREGGLYNLEEALKHAEEAVRLAPHLDAAHKAYAYTNHQIAEWLDRQHDAPGSDARADTHRDRAVQGYRAAISANPSHFIAYNNLANLYLGKAERLRNAPEAEPERMSLLTMAKNELDRALEINAAFTFAHDNLGNVYAEMGVVDDAYRCYVTALRYDKDYPEAHNDIALLLLRADFVKPPDEKDAAARHRDAIAAARSKASGGATRQIDKLCSRFDARFQELQQSGDLDPTLARDSVAAHQTCTQRPAQDSATLNANA